MENKQENNAEEKKKSPFEDYIEARKGMVEAEQNAIEACKDLGYDFDLDEDFEELPEPPKKVRIRKPASIADGIAAEKLAKTVFGLSKQEDPSLDQIMLCKMSALLKFDGKQMNPKEIMVYGEDFFMMLQARFQKLLM